MPQQRASATDQLRLRKEALDIHEMCSNLGTSKIAKMARAKLKRDVAPSTVHNIIKVFQDREKDRTDARRSGRPSPFTGQMKRCGAPTQNLVCFGLV